ncbi:hypothetical protein F5Y15DRAFT_387135 [Xylariaceae sp. FL0016]|nr:hypothetical protein F5Y15DRAFT_387135 [Xylariaceae sp. FL0016]
MAKSISAGAREKETLRYAASSIAATTLLDSSSYTHPAPSFNTEFVADPVLLSLAQLAALRLGASGAFISFFDSKYQHVVAHAGPDSRIHPGHHHDVRCHLQGRAIPRPSSVCARVMFEPAITEPHESQDRLPVVVIPDLASDTRIAPHIRQSVLPNACFYASVPVKSPRGILIGVVAVYDGQLRQELDFELLTFLRDISYTITSHLSSKRTRADLRRSERMVRGLGSFVEGGGSMSFNTATANPESFENIGVEGNLNVAQQQIQLREKTYRETLQPTYDINAGVSDHSYAGTAESFSPSTPLERIESSRGTSPNQFGNHDPAQPSSVAFPAPSVKSTVSCGTEASENEHGASIKAIFSRAANVIRESIEVEGVLFLDASVKTFGGLVRAKKSSDSDPLYSSDESSGEDPNRFCDVFAYSTSAISSIDSGTDHDASAAFQGKVPERFLKGLFRRYPEGKIFDYDEEGCMSVSGESSGDDSSTRHFLPDTESSKRSSSDDTRTRHWPKKALSRRSEGDIIVTFIPGARSVLIVPLWDANKEQWYAGGVIWTCTPARVFSKEGELSYLRAFGMTIMAELSRLETLAQTKAKSDVLGSLSHELRSPLHGIVAAVDLLHDTTLDAFQCDVVHSMESCGRVLLDVMNHLLDYSKVNALIRDAREEKAADTKNPPAGTRQNSAHDNNMRLLTDVQLDALVEESINSAFAGHVFQKMSIAQLKIDDDRHHADVRSLRRSDTIDAVESFGHHTNSSGDFRFHVGDVSVLMDIDPNVSWNFRTQPGALRRIILNILGNSLRYTNKGFITISVEQEKRMSKKKQPTTYLKLTFIDTGKGIGPEFMQQKLFTPFAQEDRLTQGTGLGLSLVRQIVRTLKGSIQVESQVGLGTNVQISIPVPPPPTGGTPIDEKFEKQKSALSGLRVAIIGIDSRITQVPALTHSPPLSLSKLMHSICLNWLKLQVVKLDDERYRPDLIICGQSGMEQLLSDKGREGLLAPVVILCKDAVQAHDLSKSYQSSSRHKIFEFMSQPAGPRKLARALDTALARWTEVAQMGMPDTPISEPSRTFPSSTSGIEQSSLEDDEKHEAQNDPQQTQSSTDDVPEGAASTVEIYRPMETIEQHPDNFSKKSHFSVGVADSPPPREQKILLVDDNDINLRILVAFMKKLKRSCATASNGLEAFEKFAAEPSLYSCVLMDLSMPVMDGLEATRSIREFEKSQQLAPATPIIALTGLASASSQQEAFASGMDLYLTKPVKLKELTSALSEKDG